MFVATATAVHNQRVGKGLLFDILIVICSTLKMKKCIFTVFEFTIIIAAFYCELTVLTIAALN